MTWLRRLFHSVALPAVLLKSYRPRGECSQPVAGTREDDIHSEAANHRHHSPSSSSSSSTTSSDYENSRREEVSESVQGEDDDSLAFSVSTTSMDHDDSREGTPLDVSIASEESIATITQASRAASSEGATPVPSVITLHNRRRSTPRRNYRILGQEESVHLLQLHSSEASVCANEQRRSTKLLKRRSQKARQAAVTSSTISHISAPAPVSPATASGRSPSRPALLPSRPAISLSQDNCDHCEQRKRLSVPSLPSGIIFGSGAGCLEDAPSSMSTSFTARIPSDEGQTRLSFVSSSTGYSSARSSLRSSCDDSPCDSSPNHGQHKHSAARRAELLKRGSALSQLDRICIELLDTERAFVSDLQDIVQGYLNHLIARRDSLHITVDDVSATFGCIERIFALNKVLYQQLDACQLDAVKMCQVFIDNASKFEDYVTYCTNYQKMLSSLCVLTARAGIGHALQSQQKALGHSLPLSAYLLKPVQRILKYHLFIENMQKELTVAGAEETSLRVVRRALQEMTGQAARMNDEKKRSEHAERVAQLQKVLADWRAHQTGDLSAYGELLLEASFRLAGSKTTRQLFLFEEMLLIAKQRNNQLIAKDFIMCSNLMLNESVSTDPLAFQVLSFDSPRAQYIFLASSADQKRVWMRELKRAVLDHFELQIPEETKRLMLSIDCTQQKVPFGRPEFAEVSLKAAKKIPKYLERRRKSVDSRDRRRSLSTSRLTHSTSQSSMQQLEGSRVDQPKCACRSSSNNGAAVSRALSASTMDFIAAAAGSSPLSSIPSTSSGEGASNGAATPATSAPFSIFSRRKSEKEKDSGGGRGRFFQSRQHRQSPVARSSGANSMCPECPPSTGSTRPPPPSIAAPPPPSESRLQLSEQIERTFDEIYRNLQMMSANESLPDREDASRRLDELVRGKHEDPNMSDRLRSKSLTRLDEVLPSGTSPLESERERQLRLQRYEKVGGWLPTEQQNIIRRSRHAPTLPDGRGGRSEKGKDEGEKKREGERREADLPHSNNHRFCPLRSAARQRTPISAEQCRAMDTALNLTPELFSPHGLRDSAASASILS